MTGSIELDLHRVEAGDLHDVFYIPEFVSEEEEGYLIRQVCWVSIKFVHLHAGLNFSNRDKQCSSSEMEDVGKPQVSSILHIPTVQLR